VLHVSPFHAAIQVPARLMLTPSVPAVIRENPVPERGLSSMYRIDAVATFGSSTTERRS
jgi:hypothetical protein